MSRGLKIGLIVAAVVVAALLIIFVDWKAALALAVGVEATRRRSANRDRATTAREEHRANVEAESQVVEERRERAEERREEAERETLRTMPPATPEEREERLRALGKDPFA